MLEQLSSFFHAAGFKLHASPGTAAGRRGSTAKLEPGMKARGALRVTRLYVGDEFCPSRLPTLKELKSFLAFAHDSELGFTLLTPFFTDKDLEKHERLFDCLVQEDPVPEMGPVEIVVNDLGLMQYLGSKTPFLSLAAGRLLNRGFKDPRAPAALHSPDPGRRSSPASSSDGTISPSCGRERAYTKEASTRSTTRKTRENSDGAVRAGGDKDGAATRLSKNEKESLLADCTFGQAEFRRFVKRLGVERLERDLLPYESGGVSRFPGFAVSIYFPYGYFTTGRVCWISSFDRPVKDKFLPGKKCSRPCQGSLSQSSLGLGLPPGCFADLAGDFGTGHGPGVSRHSTSELSPDRSGDSAGERSPDRMIQGRDTSRIVQSGNTFFYCYTKSQLSNLLRCASSRNKADGDRIRLVCQGFAL